MVGVAGLEPATPTPPVWCATRLRYTPLIPRFGRAHYTAGDRGGQCPENFSARLLRLEKLFDFSQAVDGPLQLSAKVRGCGG